MYYRMIGKADNMTEAGEFIADATLGKPVSEHLLFKLMACYPPDGMVFVDDDEIYWITYRSELVLARPGTRIKTIPGSGKDVTLRELAEEMRMLKQLAMEQAPHPVKRVEPQPAGRVGLGLSPEYLEKLRNYRG